MVRSKMLERSAWWSESRWPEPGVRMISTSSPWSLKNPSSRATSRGRSWMAFIIDAFTFFNDDVMASSPTSSERAFYSSRIRPFVPEAFLEMAATRQVALLEDPGIAALGIGQDLPGVVVAVPEQEAVGAVPFRRLGDVVQAPLRGLLGALAPGLVDIGVGVDVEAVVVAARHAFLVPGMDHRVDMVAAEPDHQRDRAGAHYLQAEEFLVEAPRRLEVFRAERAVRNEARLERRHRVYSSLMPASLMNCPHIR